MNFRLDDLLRELGKNVIPPLMTWLLDVDFPSITLPATSNA